MFEKRFCGIFLVEDPALERVCIECCSELFLEIFLPATLKNYFSGLQRLKQLIDVFQCSFRNKKFTCGDVEESNARLFVGEMN